MKRPFALAMIFFCVGWPARPIGAEEPVLDTPRPIEAIDTVFMEEMTWMEVRDAIAGGKTTAIVATGGVEQNGPYVATGKHNYILRATTQAIARRLGNALVAPIVPFVPEGDIDPPTEHMRYPGTISVSEATFEALLTDICASLRAHGFKNIVLLGDSGGNQTGMKRVAERLNRRWAEAGPRVHYIAEYYDYRAVTEWLEKEGIHQVDEGLHDDFAVTALLMTVDPNLVRMKERGATGKFSINGVELAPAPKTIEWGKRIIDFRANAAVSAIEHSIGP
ncbi:MAG TPA: creatininase family protein [Pirellulales bacterium]|nr:creatininase family protein [Pirellulales bacterium]